MDYTTSEPFNCFPSKKPSVWETLSKPKNSSPSRDKRMQIQREFTCVREKTCLKNSADASGKPNGKRSQWCHTISAVCSKNVRFGSNYDQISQKWDKSVIFFRSVSVHFGPGGQNVLKLILKSHRFVTFGANLIQFRTNSHSLGDLESKSYARKIKHLCLVKTRIFTEQNTWLNPAV